MWDAAGQIEIFLGPKTKCRALVIKISPTFGGCGWLMGVGERGAVSVFEGRGSSINLCKKPGGGGGCGVRL